MLENTQVASAPVTRMALEPYPINPFRWHAILETAGYYQNAEVNTRAGSIDSDPQRDVIYKPPSTAATEAAKPRCWARSISIGAHGPWCATWARSPSPGSPRRSLPANRTWTTVEFTDLRFAYSMLGASSARARAPLAGYVYIVDGREDAGEIMNGREQK